MKERRVVVIGAGISGLTTAWWLRKKGIDVTVLEKEQSSGGTMRTLHDNGWLVETGPNSALETTPLFQEMFEELGILDQLLYSDAKAEKRYILRDGRLHVLPTSPTAFLTSSLCTTIGKLRLLREPFIGRAVTEETVAQFVERRLGKEFLDYVFNPFVAGVYAGRPEQLSVRDAFPKLHALEEKYGSLIKGMMKGAGERKQRGEKIKDRTKMFSFVGGLQIFPDAIARNLGERILYGCEVLSIGRTSNGQDYSLTYKHGDRQSTLTADSVVLAVPAFVASKLILAYAPDFAELLDNIYYSPVVEVFLGFRSDQVSMSLDGFGFLVPQKEKRNILGTIWSSAIFPQRAPDGYVALTSFVGGARQPELMSLDDAKLKEVVTDELTKLMHVKGGSVYSQIIRWQKAIPQYNIGHDKVMNAIDQFEKTNQGAYFCANYRGGVSVGDCVVSGESTSRRVMSELERIGTMHNRIQEVNA